MELKARSTSLGWYMDLAMLWEKNLWDKCFEKKMVEGYSRTGWQVVLPSGGIWQLCLFHRYSIKIDPVGTLLPVQGLFDKKGGRRYYHVLSKRWHLLQPLLSNEPTTGSVVGGTFGDTRQNEHCLLIPPPDRFFSSTTVSFSNLNFTESSIPPITWNWPYPPKLSVWVSAFS
jgi:hypothetical protein